LQQERHAEEQEDDGKLREWIALQQPLDDGIPPRGFGLDGRDLDNFHGLDSLDFDGGGHCHCGSRFNDRRRRHRSRWFRSRRFRSGPHGLRGFGCRSRRRSRRRGFSRARSCNPALDGGKTIGRSVELSAQTLELTAMFRCPTERHDRRDRYRERRAKYDHDNQQDFFHE
jgi:hypothetical protein